MDACTVTCCVYYLALYASSITLDNVRRYMYLGYIVYHRAGFRCSSALIDQSRFRTASIVGYQAVQCLCTVYRVLLQFCSSRCMTMCLVRGVVPNNPPHIRPCFLKSKFTLDLRELSCAFRNRLVLGSSYRVHLFYLVTGEIHLVLGKVHLGPGEFCYVSGNVHFVPGENPCGSSQFLSILLQVTSIFFQATCIFFQVQHLSCSR